MNSLELSRNIEQVIKTLAIENQITEVRILKTRYKTVSGYFNQPAKLAAAVAEWSGKAPGIYITLNPVAPPLLSRSANHLKNFADQTTNDADIVARWWFMIDFDVKRPAGISSTDAEHETAIAKAEQTAAWLKDVGFPEGILADSGNGGHLLYRIDLPNTPETTALIKKCLEALDQKFSDKEVKIDLTCFNAARIWKLYGTMACKGDSTPDRPWRMSKLLSKPDMLEIVGLNLLEKLAALAKEPEKKSSEKKIRTSDFDLQAWITEHQLGVQGPSEWGGGQKWIFEVCPWNPDHINGSAGIFQLASGAIIAKCHHDGCVGKDWHALRDLVEPGWRDKVGGTAANLFNLPILRADDHNLRSISSATLTVLREINDPPFIFRHTDIICYIGRADDGTLTIKPFNDNAMRHLLSQVIFWVVAKKKGMGTAPALPPLHVVRDILAMPEPPFPVLNRIVRSPIFAADGTLLQEPGYSAISRTYYDPPTGFVPKISLTPSADDMTDARAIIDDLFCDFPFTGGDDEKKIDSERTHAMALFILPFARELVDGPTPLHLIEKPSPGTGAGLLTETISTVFLGHSVATMTEGRDEDEWRKRITAKLLSHNDLIVIDNVQHRLESSNLSAALTSEIWEDRPMTKSVIARIPVKMTWIANGNNPTLSNEISRRTVRIRLDSKTDRPWLRESFRHANLREYVAQNRESLVAAVLTLIQDWVFKGKIEGKHVLGSYERWSKVIGGILANAGYKDFLANIMDLYEQSDSEGDAWRTLVIRWWETYHENDVAVSDIYPLIHPEPILSEQSDFVTEPIDINLGKEGLLSQKSRLGHLLKQMRDRQFDVIDKYEKNVSLRIIKSKAKRLGAQLWHLQEPEPWN